MVFTDFVVPGLGHVAGLFIATVLVSLLIYAIRPPLTEPIVMAIVPWIVSGAILHVFYQMHVEAVDGLFPEQLAPFFSAPSVYFTTFALLGIIWVMSTMIVASPDHDRQIAMYLGVIGIGVMTVLVVLAIWQGMGEAFELNLIEPTLGLIISLVLAFVIFIAIGLWRTHVIANTRYVGFLVIFAHVFDAITTAIGVEVMGFGERTVIPRMIMDFAADLPTADYLGEAWLFVLLKIIIAAAIVIMFSDYSREKPAEANLFFAIVVAVGLGPGVNNFFLFALFPQ